MKNRIALLTATALSTLAAAPAHAQESELSPAEQMAELREQMAALIARVDQLESELAEAEAQAEAANSAAEEASAAALAANTAASQANATASAIKEEADAAPKIAFKGTPQISTSNGWSFKPRGRLQFDAGFVNAPDDTAADSGFFAETRRARLGASGDLPGGFGYKVELDFAASDLTVTDAIISYESGDVEILAGQFNTFQGLEELTSSLHTSFIERAAFTDAFNFERRVGLGAVYHSGDILLQGGVFTDNMDDLSNRNWSVDGRAVYAPKVGETQLHFGGSIHHAELEQGTTVSYDQPPLVSFTPDSFVDTGSIAASSETGFGLEAAAIAGPFHVLAETFWQNVDVVALPENPTFFGGSIEVGYFLTKGDTRSYKKGTFDRVKPVNPVGEGGVGSFQINARYDRLDLTDAGIIGGTQDGYFFSVVWKPTDYTLLLANYGRLDYNDAVFPTSTGSTDYSVDVFGMRAQIDF